MDHHWLLGMMAIVAFVAVGCSSGAERTVVVDATSIAQEQPTSASPAQPTPVPTVARPELSPTRLVIAPQPAMQAGDVKISGDGFAANETVIVSAAKSGDSSSATVPLGTTTTRADGGFEAPSLPLSDQLESGPHPITAVGQSSGRTGTATLWIRAPKPWLVVDNYDVPQYGDLGFIAGGFEPMDEVTASVQPTSGAAVQLATLTMDQAGNAQWTQLKLPRLASATYAMVLTGRATGAELRRDIHVTPLKPLTELSPWAGPPGVPVQFNARGFAPNEQVRVQVGGAQDATPLQTDEYGNLWAAGPIHIPQNAAPGELQLALLGADSGATSSATFKVLEPKPWLELTSWSGAPGAPVGFGGGGWIGNEKVSIHLGSATTPVEAVGTADENGWLKATAQVYIPNEVSDDVIFVAVGEQSHMVAAATFRVVFPFGLRPGAKPRE